MSRRREIRIGGPPRAPAELLYEAVCVHVAKLPMLDRKALAYAMNDGDPYESLPGSVKAMFVSLAAWAWAHVQPTEPPT
jgi:hypothetical protein